MSLVIAEPLWVKRADITIGIVGWESEDQFQMRISGNRLRAHGTERSDVNAFVDRFEEAGERGGTLFSRMLRRPGGTKVPPSVPPSAAACVARYRFFVGGGFGVGVFVRYLGVHFFSIEERMATVSAPERYISIASRATSMQTCHP